MSGQERDKKKPLYLSDTDKKKLEKDVASLVKQGWVVEKRWGKYASHFVTLVWKKS